MSNLRTISLYTGAGGLDYGFRAAGIETGVALDSDPDCYRTLKINLRSTVILADIASVPTATLLEKSGFHSRQVPLLIGGPPCQPFSKSSYWATGDAKRLNDARASTLGAFLRVLGEALPRVFVLENVEGLGYKGKSEGLALMEKTLAIINKKRRTNYKLSIQVLNAADFGVPQIRRRIIIVGSRDGQPFKFPVPTHVGQDLRPRHVTAWEALRGVPVNAGDVSPATGKWADLLPSIPEGYNYLWHTDRSGGLPIFGWRTRYWSFLLKLAKDRPAWTIQATPGPATGPFHWTNRRLSVKEMCRLQTFPLNVEIKGSYSSAQRQVGNAVPSLLAEILAREIRRQFFNSPLTDAGPLLEIEKSSRRAPPPQPTKKVPRKYYSLLGSHLPHPGAGRGPRASLGIRTKKQFELAAE
jgi:DNA (cytosine-5)-methyltransferase 1